MAKRAKPASENETLELPEHLADAIEHAKKLIVPYPQGDEEIKLPNLFRWLTPMLVPDPKWNGQGKQKRVLREPLLLLSFDRRAGSWKVTLSDSTLNLGGSCVVHSLLDAFIDVEHLMANNKFPWSEKKIT
jgi:hypothetical protein